MSNNLKHIPNTRRKGLIMKERRTIFGNPITDGRFEWATPEKDKEHLRHAISLAYKATALGNEPYASILVGPDGEFLLEGLNSCLAGRDSTGHGEMNVIRQASQKYDPDFLWKCSIYVPGTPCPMCACAIFYSNIGRVVSAIQINDSDDYKEWNLATLSLSLREILQRGNKDIVIDGPYPELTEECLKKLEGFDPMQFEFYQKSFNSLIKPK